MVIRWQPLYSQHNSFSTLDREFDRLQRQLEWALRDANLNSQRLNSQRTKQKNNVNQVVNNERTESKPAVNTSPNYLAASG
ncbi:hypothetical protein Pse7367_3288 [Thalassoporum mexicanum PCC 7367]|uniref:hypothetical protein n=1 Tax=Thalassoporum mexicanum TaxID=3457544 RepID=UPI00029FCC2E|nr:hypothetical protein [Pseudanabaena sp. PCC 7367]AFY71528.1 hypothetical protein Pse7367_3288 [Pseudanabaena sp. PCC 7367]